MKNAKAILSVKFNSVHNTEKLTSICAEDLPTLETSPGFFKNIISPKDLTERLVASIFFETSSAKAASGLLNQLKIFQRNMV